MRLSSVRSVLVASLFCAECRSAHGAFAPGEARTQGDSCRLVEVGRGMLTTADGRPLYVEPSAVVSNGRQVLIAGQPTIVWRQVPDSGWLPQMTDSVFGVIVAPGRQAQIIPMPPGIVDTLSGPKAVANRDGSWTVVWIETDSIPQSYPRPPVRRVRSGTVRDGRWVGRIESLPVPPWPASLEYRESSALVAAGDSIVWALPVSIEGSLRKGGVYVRHGNRWTFEFLPEFFIVDIQPGWSRATGLVAAVIYPDPAEKQDQNSLFLYVHDSSWRVVHRIARGGDAGAHAPQWVTASSGLVLGWTQGGSAFTSELVGDSMTPPRPRFEQRYMWPKFVAGPGRLLLWLTLHGREQGWESRVTAIDGDRVFTLGSYPGAGFNTMTNVVSLPAVPGREVLVFGHAVEEEGGTRLFTRLVEARIECGSAAQ